MDKDGRRARGIWIRPALDRLAGSARNLERPTAGSLEAHEGSDSSWELCGGWSLLGHQHGALEVHDASSALSSSTVCRRRRHHRFMIASLGPDFLQHVHVQVQVGDLHNEKRIT
uniref:Uncharacterized protein n=1 Tax=Oryza punctata TaxID=4537 RepID=A0A0E0KGF8_ORYPU